MKLLKVGIRFWITITSVLSFLTGWIMLAHAPKPIQTNAGSNRIVTPLPTLEPLNPSIGFGSDEDNFQNPSLFSIEPSTRSQFRPSFRTGGS